MMTDGLDTLLGAEVMDGTAGIDTSAATIEGGDELGVGELLGEE